MLQKITAFMSLTALAAICFVACKKTDYTFGDIKSPSGLSLSAVISGANTANPNGDGSGVVAITATAANAITYKIDFGDGNTQLVPSGVINYNYLYLIPMSIPLR